MNATASSLPLEVHRAEFASRRFLAMPLAGTIAWLAVALCGLTDLSPWAKMMFLYCATGVIAYLGMGLSYLTGERFMDRARRDNPFSRLFVATMMMSLLVFAIAIPFARADWTSLPMSIGILAGLMWLPLSWIIGHWIGWFHAVARTVLVLAAWYVWPDDRYVAVPLVIVALYVVTIFVLERRYRAIRRNEAGRAAVATA